MKKSPQTRSGFTLVEILVAAAVALVLLAGVYTLIYCANILSAKTYALNSTGGEARNALDQMQDMLQAAYTAPVPININGVALSTTLTLTGTATTVSMAPVVTGSTATITGTGAGVKFYRYVGGPYQTKISTSGLLSTASTLTLLLSTSATPIPPPPQKYDILVINRSAAISGTGFQAWATVNGTPTSSTSGSIVTYSVPLSGSMTDASGTVALTGTVIQSRTDTNGNDITWYTSLLRPTAFLFSTRVYTSGTMKELGVICPYTTLASGAVAVNTNYTTLTREVDTGTTSSTFSQFAIVSLCDEQFVSVILRVRSSDYDKYLADKQTLDGFSTFMSLNTLIDLKSKP